MYLTWDACNEVTRGVEEVDHACTKHLMVTPPFEIGVTPYGGNAKNEWCMHLTVNEGVNINSEMILRSMNLTSFSIRIYIEAAVHPKVSGVEMTYLCEMLISDSLFDHSWSQKSWSKGPWIPRAEDQGEPERQARDLEGKDRCPSHQSGSSKNPRWRTGDRVFVDSSEESWISSFIKRTSDN